jgi:hypothetical protein
MTVPACYSEHTAVAHCYISACPSRIQSTIFVVLACSVSGLVACSREIEDAFGSVDNARSEALMAQPWDLSVSTSLAVRIEHFLVAWSRSVDRAHTHQI